MEDEKYIMWLSRVEGMTGKKLERVLARFDAAEEVFRASGRTLREAGVDDETARRIERDQDDARLASYCRELQNQNIRFMSRFNSDFPSYLNEIPDPPAGLYVMGRLPGKDLIMLGVIGSRRCSEYGLTTAHRISAGVAAHGVVVVSGMARGIDSQAHRGALEAGGLTVAVLGCGVDVCYPSENRALKEKIIENGCVVSEYPPGTRALPAYFPARNRIISGLCRAVVVVEAARRSGTRITVDQALNQGRDVYAVPGNITSKLSEGTNDLIKSGASLIAGYEDVLHNLGVSFDIDKKAEAENRKAEKLLPVERLVYNCVGGEPVNLEEIVRKTGLPVQDVSSQLVLLEMEALIRKLPGQRYVRY